jgi:uncharacterized membrane protein YdjX (TVP38/TMEM64 family)
MYWAVLCMAIYGAYLIRPEFFHQVFRLLKQGEIVVLAEYLRSFGWATIAAIIVVYIVMTFCLITPYLLLAGACGIIYGIFWGAIIGWVGEMIGATLLFSYGRYFFRSVVEQSIQNNRYLKKADDYAAVKGFFAMLIGRLVPLVPSAILTSVASISNISFTKFILATAVGIIPAVFVKVLLGHDLLYFRENVERLVAVLVFIAIPYAGVILYKLRPSAFSIFLPIAKIWRQR